MHKRPFCLTVLLTVGATFMIQSANALPFNKNVQSFTSWFNQRKWSDGTKRVFFNLSQCSYRLYDYNKPDIPPLWRDVPKSEEYRCQYGFVRVYDPRGVQICKLNNQGSGSAVKYEKYIASGRSKNTFLISDAEEDCRYQWIAMTLNWEYIIKNPLLTKS